MILVYPVINLKKFVRLELGLEVAFSACSESVARKLVSDEVGV
jgi:hypothetical protein